MTLLQWLDLRLGSSIDTDHAYGPQCVDLVNDYLSAVHHAGPVAGNAVDIQHDHIPGWTWTANGPTNVPPAGAVIVWGPDTRIGTDQYGHTAVCLAGDEWLILTADQNWAAQRRCTINLHDYRGVRGWLAPQKP